jgi:hypothetical protein
LVKSSSDSIQGGLAAPLVAGAVGTIMGGLGLGATAAGTFMLPLFSASHPKSQGLDMFPKSRMSHKI